MKHREAVALALTALIVLGMPVAIVAYQYGLRPALAPTRLIDITLAAGGFRPDVVNVEVGETVTLRFSAADVAHGVAIGPGLDIDLGIVQPGRPQEVTLAFDHVGTDTFYCNVWCSATHWPVRGLIEVRDPAHPGVLPTSPPDPVLAALLAEGIDIDARPARDNIPVPADEDDVIHGDDGPTVNVYSMPDNPMLFNQWPSAENGARWLATGIQIPTEFGSLAWRRSHTPLQAESLLASVNPAIPRDKLLDVTAFLWIRDVSVPARAVSLFQKNCAVCHGQSGDGQGPVSAFTAKRPVRFTDLTRLFDSRSDVLYAKIYRGGLGTDMPNFGAVFTPEEIWTLVDYLWELGIHS